MTLPSEAILSPLGLTLDNTSDSWHPYKVEQALRRTLAYLDEQAADRYTAAVEASSAIYDLVNAGGDINRVKDALLALAGHVEPASPPEEDTPESNLVELRDEPLLTPCFRCDAPHEAHDGIGGNTCGRCLALDEYAAKLTRLKAENARHEALFSCERKRSEELRDKLTEAQRTIASLEAELATVRAELTWERGWDLLRKAQMGAAVEAARSWSTAELRNLAKQGSPDGMAAELDLAAAKRDLRKALSALDQPSQPEPASETAEGGEK